MKLRYGILAGVAVATLAFGTAQAQQMQGSAQVGEATVTIGTGTAMLFLPDAVSPVTRTTNVAPFTVFQRYDFSDNFGSNVGWNVNGSVAMPFTAGNGQPMEFAIDGFWARISGTDSLSCTGGAAPQVNCLIAPLVDNPAAQQIGGTLGAQTISGNSTRDVDNWGASAEARWLKSDDRYFSAGADIRGIFQDLDSTLNATTGSVITYRDSLDTTYYGAFAAFGGGYTPPLVSDLWQRWGLESSFRLQGGVYYADTSYDGTLSQTAPFPGGGGDPSGSLSLSRSDAAFVAGLSLETRKHISPRATLSLKSDIEYYSYVPKMKLNETDLGAVNITDPGRQVGTEIDSTGALSLRTMLRLTIALN
jgi:hypothetical protein